MFRLSKTHATLFCYSSSLGSDLVHDGSTSGKFGWKMECYIKFAHRHDKTGKTKTNTIEFCQLVARYIRSLAPLSPSMYSRCRLDNPVMLLSVNTWKCVSMATNTHEQLTTFLLDYILNISLLSLFVFLL